MELKNKVAEKLNFHPQNLTLQYRLSFSNKPLATPTDITDDDELMLFQAKMRKLIVPQKTASGKLSSRILPDVTVVFEPQGAAPDPPQGKSSGNAKKVSNQLIDSLSPVLNTL
jgi:hypothetical protein